MTGRIPDPADPMEEEGLPAMQEALPEKEITGDAQDGVAIPADEPQAVEDYGTTAAEEAAGEPLDGRLARELPDVLAEADEPAAEGEHVDDPYPEDHEERVGRLVESDEGAHTDLDPDAVALDVGTDGGGFSAEERAMRVEPET